MSLEINLIEGERGKLHVTSDDVRTEHAVMFGTGRKVLNIDEMFEGVFVSNNTVRILSGVLYNNGMFIRIDREDYKEVNIENGIGGAYRNDLICIRYERNIQTHIESAHLVVKKGTASENTATDPTYTEGNILDFDSVDEFPLYRVRLDGIRATLEPLFEVADVMDNINLYRELQNQKQADASMQQELTAHQQDKSNPHKVTVNQLGLGNVDNTADIEKPMSNPQKVYLDSVLNPVKETLNNVSSVANSAKNSITTHLSDTTNPHRVTKTQVGLDKVDNTADKDKNVKYSDTTGKLSKAVKINGVDFDGSKDITIGDSERNMISDTATGEHITVTNSADAPVRSLRIDGRTEQFTTTGKNLLGIVASNNTTINGVTFTINKDRSITANGTATSGVNFFINSDIQIGAGQYIITGCPQGGDYGKYNIQLKVDGDWKAENYDIGNGRTINATQGISQSAIVISNGVTVNNLTFYPMIRKAEITDATYEPYTGGMPSPNPNYPQDIIGVGNNGNVEVTVTGKNVFDISKALVGNFNSDGDFEIIYGVRRFYEYNFKENTQYTFSGYVKNENTTGAVRFKIFYTDGTADNACLYHTTTEYKYITYTSAIGKTISHIESYYSSSGSMRIKNGELQIEEGTVATEYEPYKSQTVKIPIDSGFLSIPTLYDGDSATVRDGGIDYVRHYETIVFDGSESWNYSNDMVGYERFGLKLYDDKVVANSIKCNAFSLSSLTDRYGIVLYADGYIDVMNKDITSLAEWKTWLSQNPITVVYELTEPKKETYNKDIDLSMYSPVTNITNSDNANMEVEYFVDSANGNIVADLQKEIDRKADKEDISRLDTNKANKSDLKNYIVKETFEVSSDRSIATNDRTDFGIAVNKSGYIPVMATFYSADITNINCTSCFISNTDAGYVVNCTVFNLEQSAATISGKIDVLYVKDI